MKMLSSIIFFLFSIPCLVLSQTILNFQKYDLPSNLVGPFSVAFDLFGRGPFTGVADGRILQYDTIQNRFTDFGFTSPNRTKIMCDGTNSNDDQRNGEICGRPLGLEFYYARNTLYITDAYKGLVVIDPTVTRLASSVATAAEGQPFKFPFHLDVDQLRGDVYFTDFSSRFSLSQFQAAIDSGDSTGRLLKYTRATGEVTVLLRNLSGAAGVVMSHDRTYLLVSELIANRIKKFFLVGPNAFTATDLITLEGRPVNIKKNTYFDYWVAVNTRRIGQNGSLIRVPSAVRFTGNGVVVTTLDLSRFYPNVTVSEIQARPFGSAYVGSLRADYLGRVFYI